MKQECQIVWFKKDLRINDHRPLLEASKTNIPTIPVYFFETDYWKQPFASKRHWYFIHDSLIDLKKDIKSIKSELLLLNSDVINFLELIKNKFELISIYSHEETSNSWTYKRDVNVINWCNKNNVNFFQFPTNGIIRKLNDRNEWSRLRNERMSKNIFQTPKILKKLNHDIKSDILTKENSLFSKDDNFIYQKGGRKEGLILLDKFLNDKLDNYLQNISGPNNSDKYCSRLSPHLTYGTLSVKEIYKKIKDFKYKCEKQGLKYNKRGLSAFSSRLSWRCHFIQKLEDQPSIENKCMHSSYEGMREKKSNTDKLKAWETGFTGFPFVDACMRSLTYNGWITFRMRAMLTSFASYDLWIDWRESGYVLARLFTDYEPGIHYSQLQMQSGVTGINTLRIYNPIKQSIEHDKEGEFIKKWVPELKNVPSMFIHEPWKMNLEEQTKYSCILGKHYPLPIVDHKEAVRMARDKISKVRKDDNYKAKSKNVYNKHGSRKKVKTVRPVRTKKTTDQLVLI